MIDPQDGQPWEHTRSSRVASAVAVIVVLLLWGGTFVALMS